MEDDRKMAVLARALAEALAEFAYERDPDSRVKVMRLQSELCALRRRELDEQP